MPYIFQVCPYARQCEIVHIVKPFLQTGMCLAGLCLATQVGVPSLYPHVGVMITVEEVTINHLYWKLSVASLFKTLCNPVKFWSQC